MEHEQQEVGELRDRVVNINRVTKVVKGGKNFSFSALVVVGDGNGYVGFAAGKAREVPSAIAKGVEHAKRNLVRIPLEGATIPHMVVGRYGAGTVLLKPASPGTGVIAGGAVRAVVESAGIHDILTKCLGSSNKYNAVYATVAALQALRSAERISQVRGVDLNSVIQDYPVNRYVINTSARPTDGGAG